MYDYISTPRTRPHPASRRPARDRSPGEKRRLGFARDGRLCVQLL